MGFAIVPGRTSAPEPAAVPAVRGPMHSPHFDELRVLHAPFTSAACVLIGRLRGRLADRLASRTLTTVGCRIGAR